VTHQFREDGSHYNGGKVFFGYGYVAVGEPRLKMIRRWYRQGEMRGKTEDRFFVDGAKVDDYDAALEALKVPVAFTPEEIAALGLIGDVPEDWRKVVDYDLLHALNSKGAIAWGPPGRCQRTEAGRATLSPSPTDSTASPPSPGIPKKDQNNV
jgi:hypothetical protein